MNVQYTDRVNHMQVEIRSRNCEVPIDERARIQERLSDVGERVRDLPMAQLTLTLIAHLRAQDYHCEAKLRLPGRTLLTGQRSDYLDSAFQGCVDRLTAELDAYLARPNENGIRQAGQRRALDNDNALPEDPNAGPVGRAVQAGDYRAFRIALAAYEEWLRKRVGRWVQRFPDAEDRIGRDILIGDLIEEVYLSGFERYTRRPMDVRMSEWLDKLIDPALQQAIRRPSETHEEASLARTVRQAAV
jgi:ribosome-associated translation inhibitor RaiA